MKVKLEAKIWKVAFLVVAVLGVATVTNASYSSSFRESLIEGLVAKITPDLLLERLGLNQPAEENQTLGLATISSSNTGLTNVRIGGVLQRGSSSSTYIYDVSQMDVEEFPTGTNTLKFTNGRSTTSSLTRLIFDMTGTAAQIASSSFRLNCGTSTLSSVNNDVVLKPRGIIDGYLVATGSQKIVDSADDGDNGTLGRASVLVAPGQNVLCSVVHGESATGCGGTVGECENVTSTNRGWRATVKAFWNWTDGV